jgi:hypothetical protein
VPIKVHHPAFQSQRLSVEPASGFVGPKILLNGVAVTRRKGRYSVMSDSGTEILVKIKYNLVDPIPTLMIDDQPVKLVEPLQWYEYGWSGLVGGYATVVNGRIFRSDRGPTAKYGLSGVVTVSAIVVFSVLAVAFRLMIGRHK